MSGNSATDFSVSTSPISPEIRLFSQSQGGPHCALNLDYLRLSDFCAGVQPFAETHKSLEGSSEPCREVHAVGVAQISTRSS